MTGQCLAELLFLGALCIFFLAMATVSFITGNWVGGGIALAICILMGWACTQTVSLDE